MNIKPKNFTWPELYDNVIDITAYTFSWKNIRRRFTNSSHNVPRFLNFIRGISQEGFGRIKYHKLMKKMLEEDRKFRDYFEGENDVLPDFFHNIIKKDLGQWYEQLPQGAIYHDQNAYLKSQQIPIQKKAAVS